MDNEPIFKITKLEIADEDLPALVQEQEAELENSIPVEAGTLFFASGHDDNNNGDNYMVELYRNSEAYEEHSMANYFDDYDKTIDHLAKSRKVYDLKPEWITTKPKEALDSYANNFVIRVTKIEIADKEHDKFAAIVKKEMRRAMAEEAGVEILMAGSNIQNENEWLFFEVYVDDQAYATHIKTQGYQDYLKASAAIVKDKTVCEVKRDVMAIQGPIVLD